MKHFFAFILLISFSVFFPNLVIGHSKTESQIYPTADQILITPYNLFVYSIKKDKLIKVERIECINDKVCTTVLEDPNKKVCGTPCPVHPIWHQACKGCGVILYPFNCKCYD